MSLAFIGDSLTYGWLTEGIDAWNESFAPLGAANFGVPGDLTDDVVRRIEAGELDAAEPDTIVLLVGTNDLGSGRAPERTVRGIEACVEALLARFADARVMLLALLPRGDAGASGYARVSGVNARLAKFAGGGRVRFVGSDDVFLDDAGRVIEANYDRDLLHLAPAGYRAWSPVLRAAVLS